MDGFQGKLRQSLQFRLSAWLCGVIAMIAVAGGIVSFLSAFQEAIELQDDQLRQMAALFDGQQLPVPSAAPHVDKLEGDPDSRVMVQWLRPASATFVKPTGALSGLPANLSDGIQTTKLGGTSWRVFVKTVAPGARVAIGQRTEVRDEIARDSAQRTLMPFLILIPVLLLLVGGLIRNMFRPLKTMALELDRRSEQDLREVAPAHLPSEVRPFVVAINRLLSRVGQSVSMQRRFVADAAHELRSPLTALSLQAEQLDAADMSAHARERLAVLRSGIRRTRSLLDQLLTLARVQDSSRERTQTVSVQQVFRQVLEDLMPLAEVKDIDAGVVGAQDASVMAPEADLKTLVKNLVDNAIRYTPSGGQINLSVRTNEGQVTLQVTDTGPGIAPEERQRVFDPFYRIVGQDEVGSGLGLSIVQTIADRFDAKIDIGYASEPTQSGLRIAVAFPASASVAPENPSPRPMNPAK
ncbi:ATP-binding protein [Polaromonas sp. C04]|uniref:ATP-binding protein n=1 Tax=Polaromonas sp. C04 TaxID=1945857 RepID=UPI0009871B38|nr:ATP-binding protein [Polaromonas sp. C04]OOG57570.1 two-component sensor histidine kinase [Polaromonas sp. C04]